MQHQQPGRYAITSYSATEVHAFIPNPLPPENGLDLGRLQKLLDKALVAIGKLDSIAMLLPDPRMYLSAYIRKESVLSSEIEGTFSTLTDVLLYELGRHDAKSIDDDLIEVANYARALEYGLSRLLQDDFPLSNRLIKEIHEILLNSGRGSQKSPGEFRRTQNWIGGTRPDNAHFVPPPVQHVDDCMSDLEKFIHSENIAYSGLIKTALAHVQFETIHPFLDGNGRVGRLLITLQLYHEGLLSRSMLYISLYINKHRDEYYKLLNDVRTEGKWEDWLEFFLNAVLESSEHAVSVAMQLKNLFQNDELNIRNAGGRKGSAVQIHQAFQKDPILTISNITQSTGLTFPAVSKGVSVLEHLGIVRELTGKQRNRVYAYSNYIAILGDDSAP